MDLAKYSSKTQTVILAAQKIAQNSGHQGIEPEHLFSAMLRDGEVQAFLSGIGSDPAKMLASVEVELSKIKKTLSGKPFLAPRFLKVASAAEAIALRMSSKSKVSTAHIMLAFVDPTIGDGPAPHILRESGATKDKIEDALRNSKPIVRIPTLNTGRSRGKQVSVDSPDSALSKYTVDLTARARTGKVGPIIGRDDEIRRVVQIISRYSKNNPVLIGKPGIGKRAIIDGLALRIASGDVPATLKNRRILTLNLGSLMAGASLRGQYEERVKELLGEIKSDGSVLLFIDEIQGIVGSDGKENGSPAALLKPALANGEIQVLGATTPEEYRKTIEKDKALERRFQPILVEEPNVEETLRILRGIKSRYEVHHGVRIQDPALVAAIALSKRYLADRSLPDKAIDLIDEAASRLKIGIDSVPEELDSKERRLTQIKMELHQLASEVDRDTQADRTRLEKLVETLETEVAVLRGRWENEVSLIQTIRATKEELVASQAELEEAEKGGDIDHASDLKYGSVKLLGEKLGQSTDELNALGGRLIKEEVGSEDIARVLEDLTGISVSTMLESEKEKFAQMESRLGERIIGQRKAVEAVSDAIRRAKSGLGDVNRPLASFAFFGTSGSGKTELIKTLAEFMFDNEKAMIRVDCSELGEAHSVARLIGSPPGYKGSDEGGQITNHVQKNPASLILLDEIEKAHPDVLNILLQIMDDGRLSDAQGKLVDFKNTVIAMTSNVGSRVLLKSAMDKGVIDEAAEKEAWDLIKKSFRPEFLGRIDATIMFDVLTKQNVADIAEIHIKKIRKMVEAKKMTLEVSVDAKNFLVDNGFDQAYGARPLRRALQDYLQNPLSRALFSNQFGEGDTIVASVDAESGKGLKFVRKMIELSPQPQGIEAV